MNKQEAEVKLKQIFGFDDFFDDQWKTIDRILQKKRVLLIEKTGFGKSLTFQFPATQFDGLTIIFSPLIALMRDQIKSLNEKGIKVGLINSEQTDDENNLTIQNAINNKLKILYIAPERQENSTWQEAVSKMNISFVVVDEAHCISSWGHDFRPAFRRIINLMQLLPSNIPVLATTATATVNVAEDIKNQIGGDIELIRGDLLRENLRLNVIHVESEEDKMAWISNYLEKVKGNGIVYTGTRSNAEIFSKWCESEKLNTIYYHAGLDSDSRKLVEKEWMSNKFKAVISTNALGMGIDKSDIRFIIHTQITQSPIHYYQEIGRAGRDAKTAEIFLLFNPKDTDLPLSFINNARPSTKKYEKVIHALKQEPLGEKNLMKATNLKQTQVRTIKADLLDQKIIREVMYGKSKKYEYQYNAPELDNTAFEALREHRLREFEKMVEYTNTDKCKMLYLCNYLGDSNSNSCEICDSCLDNKNQFTMNENDKEKIKKFQDNFFPILEVETTRTNLINGVASSYYGFSNVGAIIHKCKYENGGDYPTILLKQTLRAFGKTFKEQNFDLVLFVPPTKSGKLVENFANKIASTLKLPIAPLVKIKETKEQKIFQNGALKTENIKDAFDINIDIIDKSILLIDDIFDSGATIKEIGKMLTNKGAKIIAPLVIAKTVGGDIPTSIKIKQDICIDLTSYNRSKDNIINKIKTLDSNITDLTIYGLVDNNELTIGFVDSINYFLQLKKLKSLILRHNYIDSLNGINNLKNLETLDLGDNTLKKIDEISSLKSLTELHLQYNRISNIEPLKFLTNLETLSLAYNNFTNIDSLKELKMLKWLSLSGNNIDSFDVLLDLPNLEVVAIEDTNIDKNITSILESKGVTFYYWYEFWH